LGVLLTSRTGRGPTGRAADGTFYQKAGAVNDRIGDVDGLVGGWPRAYRPGAAVGAAGGR
jgi:hypothetical protein